MYHFVNYKEPYKALYLAYFPQTNLMALQLCTGVLWVTWVIICKVICARLRKKVLHNNCVLLLTVIHTSSFVIWSKFF